MSSFVNVTGDLGSAPQTTFAAPSTKTARQALVRQILDRSQIRSQSELREALAQRGVMTTQATLSRDLVELRATKVRTCDGVLVYSVPEAGAPGQVRAPQVVAEGGEDAGLAAYITPRLSRWCADLLVTAEWSGGQLVLRTPLASAQLLASAVDDCMLPGVLGCIAGDDTVLVICRSEEIASEVGSHLLRLADPGSRQ